MPPEPANDSPREFRCIHCHGKVLVPRNLPPTTGPCPICGREITSPGPETDPGPAATRPDAGLPGRLEPPAPMAADPPRRAVRESAEMEREQARRERLEEERRQTREPERRAAPETETDRTARERATPEDPRPEPARPRKSGFPTAAVAMLVLLVALAAGGWFVVQAILSRQGGGARMELPDAAAMREMRYIERGWQADAFDVLSGFLSARTPAAKAARTIQGDAALPRMEAFYNNVPLDDSDTPAEAFSAFPLPEQDRRRGIFMLVYDQPPAFEISEFFRPLAPLDVSYGLREPGILLSTVAKSSNFTAEPLKIQAFFKRGPEGLRLDWETFVQTKYRTFRDFLELPVAGRAEIFRVILSETVPEKRNVPVGSRTYLIADPAYSDEDSARVNVRVDSDLGRRLSVLNWRGTHDGRAHLRTATLELRWTREEIPQLEISRFLCWEFLGVGGEIKAEPE